MSDSYLSNRLRAIVLQVGIVKAVIDPLSSYKDRIKKIMANKDEWTKMAGCISGSPCRSLDEQIYLHIMLGEQILKDVRMELGACSYIRFSVGNGPHAIRTEIERNYPFQSQDWHEAASRIWVWRVCAGKDFLNQYDPSINRDLAIVHPYFSKEIFQGDCLRIGVRKEDMEAEASFHPVFFSQDRLNLIKASFDRSWDKLIKDIADKERAPKGLSADNLKEFSIIIQCGQFLNSLKPLVPYHSLRKIFRECYKATQESFLEEEEKSEWTFDEEVLTSSLQSLWMWRWLMEYNKDKSLAVYDKSVHQLFDNMGRCLKFDFLAEVFDAIIPTVVPHEIEDRQEFLNAFDEAWDAFWSDPGTYSSAQLLGKITNIFKQEEEKYPLFDLSLKNKKSRLIIPEISAPMPAYGAPIPEKLHLASIFDEVQKFIIADGAYEFFTEWKILFESLEKMSIKSEIALDLAFLCVWVWLIPNHQERNWKVWDEKIATILGKIKQYFRFDLQAFICDHQIDENFIGGFHIFWEAHLTQLPLEIIMERFDRAGHAFLNKGLYTSSTLAAGGATVAEGFSSSPHTAIMPLSVLKNGESPAAAAKKPSFLKRPFE